MLLAAAFLHTTLTHHHTCQPLNHPIFPFEPQAQDAAEQISCRVHVVNNTGSPDNNLQGHARSSLKVLAAADIQDVSVILQVQHPDVAALGVSWGGWYEDSEGKGWAKGTGEKTLSTKGLLDNTAPTRIFYLFYAFMTTATWHCVCTTLPLHNAAKDTDCILARGIHH